MAEAAASNFQVSATGGAGSAGQPAQYMSSDYERTGDAGNMELQTAAKMNKSGVNVGPTPTLSAMSSMMSGGDEVVPLDAMTQRPDEFPSTGATMGPGAGQEILSTPGMLNAQQNEDMQKLAAFLPIYARIAESPTATNATRNFYRWLKANV
jgi:hypothetical protein